MSQMVTFRNTAELGRIGEIVRRQIGNGVFVSKKSSVDDTTNYILGINIPRMIEDSRSGEARLKFIRFNNISTLEVNKKNDIFMGKIEERDAISQSVETKLSTLVFDTENVLLTTIYDKLANISLIQNSLNPAKEILSVIHKKGGLTFLEMKAGRSEKKVVNYIKLLEDLELIRKSGDRYVEGNKMIQMEKALGKEDLPQIYTKFLSVIIERGYGYVKEYLKLTSVTPYLRWSAAYYFPSAQFNSPLYLTEEAIGAHYYKIYGVEKPLLKMTNQINQLVGVGILKRDNSYLYGDKEIFSQVYDRYSASKL